MTELLALYRELVAAGAYVDTYINTRGWLADGSHVTYRVRWMRIPRADESGPAVVVKYQSWPPNNTFDVHAYWGVRRNDRDRLLLPVASIDELRQLWADIRADLDRGPEPLPEKVGQLDLLDLLLIGQNA